MSDSETYSRETHTRVAYRVLFGKIIGSALETQKHLMHGSGPRSKEMLVDVTHNINNIKNRREKHL